MHDQQTFIFHRNGNFRVDLGEIDRLRSKTLLLALKPLHWQTIGLIFVFSD